MGRLTNSYVNTFATPANNTVSVLPAENKSLFVGKIKKIVIIDDDKTVQENNVRAEFTIEKDDTFYPPKPYLNKDKLKDQPYLWKNQIRIWNGKNLLCQHKKNIERCRECHDKPIHYDVIMAAKANAKRVEISGPPIETPKLVERVIGQAYLLDGEIRIWDGVHLRCQHKKQKHHCVVCSPKAAERVAAKIEAAKQRQSKRQPIYIPTRVIKIQMKSIVYAE